jgi:hypothetical protein
MGKKRNAAQIARDRRRIADLYLQGWLQADIGDELSISQATVSRDLKALHAVWLKSALLDYDKGKARELARIDRLEREYWNAWGRSCQDAETLTQKTKGKVQQRKGERGELVAEQPAEATKTTKGQAGDPRFLAGVQWCIERRCKLLGLDRPDLVQIDWRERLPDGYEPNEVRRQFMAMIAEASGRNDNSGD